MKPTFNSTGLESRDLIELQSHLIEEDLLRKHFGKVQRQSMYMEHRRAQQITNKMATNLCNAIATELKCSRIERIGSDFSYFLFSDSWILDIRGANEDYLELYMHYTTQEQVQRIKRILSRRGFRPYKRKESDDEKIMVTFAFPGQMGLDFRQQQFEPLPLSEIACNYSLDVISKAEDLTRICKDARHGLVLLNGPVGTGKSYLIRSLLTEMRDRRAVICSPATQFLTSAQMLTGAATYSDRTAVVLEDIGDLCTTKSAETHIDARSNLLNFSSGFLSLLMDTIVIISFNYEIDKIDPAITRPGRCLSHIVVDNLCHEQAQKLVGFNIPARPYSLAEVYEMRRLGCPMV